MTTLTIRPNEIEEGIGRNEYRFFKWISHQFNGSIILEVGTLAGDSAIALADNPKNLVVTLDRRPMQDLVGTSRHTPCELPSNVLTMVVDVHEVDLTWISKVDLIYLDIIHVPEELDKFLKKIEPYFKGILIVDATNHRKYARHRDYFNALDREKHQLPASIAGCRGTGVIPYGNWTVVIEEEL